jgi:protein-tyrosine-phosphatase
MKVLFICKHNRFRSKVAEAFFNYYNKNSEHKVKSAGSKLNLVKQYVSPNTRFALKARGIVNVKDGSVQLNSELIGWADKIIVVANDVDTNLFPTKKLEVWPVHDCDQSDLRCIVERVDIIEKKVIAFLKKIK